MLDFMVAEPWPLYIFAPDQKEKKKKTFQFFAEQVNHIESTIWPNILVTDFLYILQHKAWLHLAYKII